MERTLILNLTESFWQCSYCNWFIPQVI